MSDLIHLPIGQHSFSNLRNRGYLYIDKTDLILRLIQEGDTYFLGRPRRMGKSLLVSTLEAIFEGRRELFDGLAIAKAGYDFKPHPVVRLDFGMVSAESLKVFKSDLCDELRRLADRLGVPEIQGNIPGRILVNLVTKLAAQRQVVLLIDEYDKPLVSNIEDPEQTQLFLKFLKGFYETVKGLQPSLRFTFITGVSRFSKTTLFSGMNNLKDISLKKAYATLLGITDEEITQTLLPFVSKIAHEQQQSESEILDLMRLWYNGYRFAANPATSVYNPYSLMSFLEDGELDNYWFETGTPSFALKLLRTGSFNIAELEEGVRMTKSDLRANIDAENVDVPALLFQAGYLTISDYDQSTSEYILRFPNQEVRISFFEHLVALLFNVNTREAKVRIQTVAQGLRTGNLEPLITAFNDMLGQLPHYLQRRDEAYYHSILLTMLIGLGLEVDAEKSCCTGRMDLGLRLGTKAYIFELKRDRTAADALLQIHEKQYARAYAGKGLEIHLVGINVNGEKCAVDDWKVERL